MRRGKHLSESPTIVDIVTKVKLEIFKPWKRNALHS